MTKLYTMYTDTDPLDRTGQQCTVYTELLISKYFHISLSHVSIVLSFRPFVAKPQSTRMGLDGDPSLEKTEAGLVTWVWEEISSSYLNICLTLAILYLLYKILLQKEEEQPVSVEAPAPPMKKQVWSKRDLRT